MTWRAQGFRAWLWQRISAVYMAVFLVGFLIALQRGGPWDYQGWRDWVGQGRMGLMIGLFFFAVLVHSWVGMRDVVIDYVSQFAIRFAVLTVMGVVLIGMGLWVVRILSLASL